MTDQKLRTNTAPDAVKRSPRLCSFGMACSGTRHAGTRAHDCSRTLNALHAHSPLPCASMSVGLLSHPPYPPMNGQPLSQPPFPSLHIGLAQRSNNCLPLLLVLVGGRLVWRRNAR